MKTRAREIRKRKGLTLKQVAQRMSPPTTEQTIGRLETGLRKMSLDWLQKFAAALDCTTADLIDMGGPAVPFAGLLGRSGQITPEGDDSLSLHLPGRNPVAIKLGIKTGDLEIGDTLICDMSTEPAFKDCIGRDCLVTTEDDQQVYGHLLPGTAPGRFTVIQSGEMSSVLYDVALKSAARKVMLIRHY